MNESHHTQLLAENEHAQIYTCHCCSRYTFYYKNLFMSFNQEEFENYLKLMKSLDVSLFKHYHPEGFKAILKSEQFPGCIGFTYREVNQIIQLIEESKISIQILEALER